MSTVVGPSVTRDLPLDFTLAPLLILSLEACAGAARITLLMQGRDELGNEIGLHQAMVQRPR